MCTVGLQAMAVLRILKTQGHPITKMNLSSGLVRCGNHKGVLMSRHTQNASSFPVAIQNMFRQMVRPWRMEDDLMNTMLRPGFSMLDPSFTQSFDAMTRRMTDAMLALDAAPDGLGVNVDVVEKNGTYKVQADLPGMKKEDINVSIDGKVVNIKAQTQSSTESKGEKYLFNERHFGEVSRTFTLEQDVDENKATGKYADGVLTLELPKKVGQVKIPAKPIAIQ
jgi:HSP20 family protein